MSTMLKQQNGPESCNGEVPIFFEGAKPGSVAYLAIAMDLFMDRVSEAGDVILRTPASLRYVASREG
jgi:hypothetical protein